MKLINVMRETVPVDKIIAIRVRHGRSNMRNEDVNRMYVELLLPSTEGFSGSVVVYESVKGENAEEDAGSIYDMLIRRIADMRENKILFVSGLKFTRDMMKSSSDAATPEVNR